MKNKRVFLIVIFIILDLLCIGGLVFCLLKLPLTELRNLIIFMATVVGIILFTSIFIGLLISLNENKELVNLKQRMSMWNSISYQVKKAGEIAFNNIPLGIMILSDNKEDVLWSNKYAKDVFRSELENFSLKIIESNILDNLKKDLHLFNTTIFSKTYQIEYIPEHNILYLTNITELEAIKKGYNDRSVTMGYVSIDNLEQGLNKLDVEESALYRGKVIGAVIEYFENYGAYIKAINDTRFVIMMNKSNFEEIVEDKFSILDLIKTISHKTIPLHISLSIGMCCLDTGVSEINSKANELLELALNRGGDQACIILNEETKYFGAKDASSVLEEKVDIRVKALELNHLMKNAGNIIIIPHNYTDSDGFGAAALLQRMAESLDKEVYIVLDKVDETVQKILNKIETEYLFLDEFIINSSKARTLINDKTLVIVVDFQEYVQSPDYVYENKNERLINKAKNVAIIDHHRRSNISIEGNAFYYSNTAASSSVELIMLMHEFWEPHVELSSILATWLLLGIVVDTNNYLYRVNAKTFEVSSILKEYGADLTEVQRYLKDTKNKISKKFKLLDTAQFVKDDICIAVSYDDTLFERADLAKTSDELMNYENVELGISIGYIEKGVVGVSARSLGKINAQTVMEHIGGGGHFNSSAAQIKGKTCREVYNQLIDVIKNLYQDSGFTRIILTKDLKGVGNKYDTVTVKREDALKYLSEKSCILGTDANIKSIEDKKNASTIKETIQKKKQMIIKKLIESKQVDYSISIDEAKLDKNINENVIAKIINKEFGTRIKPSQILLVNPISKFGTFKVDVILSKDVKAELTLNVCENK